MLQYHFNTLFNIIINTYLKDNYCVYLLGEKLNFNYVGNSQFIHMNKLNENETENIFHFGCQIFVLQSNEPSTIIEQLEYRLKRTLQRFNERKYIIFPDSIEFSTVNLIQVLKLLHFIPDVLVAVPEIDHNTNATRNSIRFQCEIVFRLITHRFTTELLSNDTITLDYYFTKNSSFLFNTNLFPDKLSNLQGRPLRMATFNYKPYAIVGASLEETDGTEMRVVLEYVRKFNFTHEFVVDDVNEWGEIHDNWTGNGIIGNVAMDFADIGFGALYSWYHEYGFLDLSMPVVRTGITCLAPAPRLVAGWLSPFFPFNLLMWIALVVSFFLSVLSYSLVLRYNYHQEIKNYNPIVLRKVKEKFIIFYTIVRIFLLQSCPIIRSLDKLAIRCLLTAMLIFSLLIGTCYNSGLASNMTLPRYEKGIRSVQDLADSNIDWGATHEAWIFSIELATQPTIVKLVNDFKILTENQLKSRTGTRDYAFSIERLPFGHFAIGDYIEENDISKSLLLMTEDIYWEQCVIMTRKSSPYIPALNQLILRIHAAGLSYIWETQVALHHLNYQVQLGVKVSSMQKHPEPGPVQLTMRHVQGVYILWIIGLIIGAVSFTAELFLHK